MPRRADNNANVAWTEAYGGSIEERAQNIFDGTVPDTVLQPDNEPEAGMATENVLEGNNFVEVQDINFTRRYIGHINPNDEVVYVRSQRYGEIVTGPERTRSHNVDIDIGHIQNRILKSVYAVTFDQPIINAPQAASCTCAYANDDNCKHMLAAQQFLEEHNFDDDGGGGGFVDDDDNNIMEDDDFGGFNPNEAAEVEPVDPYADTIGARLRRRRAEERQQQQPRRSTRQTRSTRRSGGKLDGDIFVSSFVSSQNQLYECVEELEKLKL